MAKGTKAKDTEKKVVDAAGGTDGADVAKIVPDASTVGQEGTGGTASVDKPKPAPAPDPDKGTASVDKPKAEVAAAPVNAGTDSVDKTPPAKEEEEVDPLSAQHNELDAQMGALYDQLVEKIKEAAVDGVDTDSSEQMRAGAVQFLRQCNATLESARQLLEAAKGVNEQNNVQLQGIQKAKVDLEKRSAAYTRMTTNGVKNEDVQ